MSGTFAKWQPEYEARGIATFPLRSDDRKRPAVGNYNKMGMPASRQLVLKWADAEGLACIAGPRNRITVVDVDARGPQGERLLADIQAEIGPSRFIVRTGSGGYHAYYRHSGERRKIRLDPRRPIDLLGGGQVVLPPSIGSVGRYEIVEGRLDDLTRLSAIRRPVAAPAQAVEATATPEPFCDITAGSGRNDALFKQLCKDARSLSPNLHAFIFRAREINEQFREPMINSRVVDTAKSVFKYFERGDLRAGNHGAWFEKPQAQALARDPYLCALITWLKAENGPESEFWIANGLAVAHLGWPIDQLREARRRAIKQGWIKLIVPAARGRNALYRWGTSSDLGVEI